MMGEGYQYIEIVIFAVVACLLVLRLRSVLGRRTGTERRRDPFAGAPDRSPDRPGDSVITLPRRGAAPAPASEDASGVARLKASDPNFAEAPFLQGARGAFEIIVNAFAASDTAALQPLLSDVVYKHFADEIHARQTRRETLETTLLTIKSTEIAGTEIAGANMLVTVKFVSDQVNVTRGSDGAVVDGNPDQVVEKTDLWTFSRPIGSRDPNWTLVATHSP